MDEWTTHPSRNSERRFCASKRRKMGAAIPSGSVCGDAELVVRGSGCHRARDGDQDTLRDLSRRDGRRTRYLEYERCHGPRMAVTCIRHSGRNGKTHGDGVPGPGRRADGEQSGENLFSQNKLRRVGSQQRLSWMQTPEHWSGATTNSQGSMPEEDRRPVEERSARLAAADERIKRALADAVDDTQPRIQE